MKSKYIICSIGVVFFLAMSMVVSASTALADSQIEHSITVEVDPSKSYLSVTDVITIPSSQRAVLATSGLLLNLGMQVTSWQGVTMTTPATTEQCGVSSCRRYYLQLQDNEDDKPGQFTIVYQGELKDKSTPIEAQGVTLGGSSVWYPQIGSALLQFELTVQLPHGWKSVSQGKRIPIGSANSNPLSPSWSGWIAKQPCDEITLIAGKWVEYNQTMDDGTELYAFFRSDAPKLAKSYLDNSKKYIELYRDLLGPYPYKKFAVVENYRQTGFGMASFTLLGSKVLRLPFILHTSLPHEILHNWWGNGVFVDYTMGNWCEGLTAYLADYWLQERKGSGLRYRRNALISYGDFVSKSNDFPLSEFYGRHNKSSQAVGYGKSAFLFHQLRMQVGDAAFVAGLRYFYRDNLFKRASYDDLQSSMLLATHLDLDDFFKQWTQRTGAPSLVLERAVATQLADSNYKITATISQTQTGPVYKLWVPITVTQVGDPNPQVFWRSMVEKSQSFNFKTSLRPMRLDVDPSSDLFRTLYSEERPVTLSKAFGAKRGLIIYPGEATKKAVAIYRKVAVAWNLGLTPDNAMSELPSNRAVWLFGQENRFGPKLINSLFKFGVGEGVQTRRIQLNGEWYDDRKEITVLVGNNPEDEKSALVQVIGKPESFPQLLPIIARKLPHYGSYSYLVFSAPDGINKLKGQWPSTGSPLSVTFDAKGNSSPSEEPPQPRPVSKLEVPFVEKPYINLAPKQIIVPKPQIEAKPEAQQESYQETAPMAKSQEFIPLGDPAKPIIIKGRGGIKSLFQDPEVVPLSSE
ncbi:MAG: M1 family peptidase [Magnetococcales bacterium]|nr:M1 family peptidase [Magnetococcales bacterium]